MNLLFTSAGRRNQLMSCFRHDASELGMDVRVLAADLKPELSPACQQADTAFLVPRCTAPDYIEALLEICRREEIRLLVPTIDTELGVLSEHVADFAAIGTRVVVSEPSIVQLAGDKAATATELARMGIQVPRTLSLTAYREDPGKLPGPVIAKPSAGSSSVGIVYPDTPADLDGLTAEDYIVQELWQGDEYTVNVFFDQEGKFRTAVPHRRIEVRGGEVSKGRTTRLPVLMDAAEKLGMALSGARGPLCFQAIVNAAGEAAVFEINARFGGGYPLAHRAGARFSRWLLEEVGGFPSTATDSWKEGVLMLRYDAATFSDD
jgi:carbamoyl-phosphate synthase large subunit